MTDPRPTWELVLQIARQLTAEGQTPFRLSAIVEGVQGIDRQRARSSIQPVVQGMTRNASGGPEQACGILLLRTDRGWYRMLVPEELANSSPPVERPASSTVATRTELLTEDEVKSAIRDHLTAQGYEVAVAWGHQRGIDIEARYVIQPTGELDERQLIEAKGEASLQPQQLNYFLHALGEVVQRTDDPEAFYGLALPDNAQYRGLVERLPPLAWKRLKLIVYFVRRGDDGLTVSTYQNLEAYLVGEDLVSPEEV